MWFVVEASFRAFWSDLDSRTLDSANRGALLSNLDLCPGARSVRRGSRPPASSALTDRDSCAAGVDEDLGLIEDAGP